jgi:hypothetical protein
LLKIRENFWQLKVHLGFVDTGGKFTATGENFSPVAIKITALHQP